MTSKAARRRNKRRTARQTAMATIAPQKRKARTQPPSQPARGQADRPTSERLRRGEWAEPTGSVKSQQPIVDMAFDVIGRLHCDGQITNAQEQAARLYQEVHARYMEELPEISGYKSCLAGGTGGYDGSDGDPAVIAEYRRICRKAGMIGERELYNVCAMGDRPRNILILRKALDDVSA